MDRIGAITDHIDAAQVVLYAFWLFFAALVLYLLRENKREGYPLIGDNPRDVKGDFVPPVPPKKSYLLTDGTVMWKNRVDQREIKLEPVSKLWGAPLQPTGDPMVDGVGPASWAEREDVPDLLSIGAPRILPLAKAEGFYLEKRDPDPRGMTCLAGDGQKVGKIVDCWVDRAEFIIRYLEVELEAGGRRLIPWNSCVLDGWRREVVVVSIYAAHFANIPQIKSDAQITRLEEEKVMAYFAGGKLYASPERMGPLL